MDATDSWLSHSKYGYDFVVSTTEASLNSDLKAYFLEGKLPVKTLCFMVDRATGTPSEMISLEELKRRANNADPFQIPHGTSHSDQGVSDLTKAGFMAGVRLQIGIPEGVMPRALPPVVVLGSSASNVTLNLMCRQAYLVVNTPANGWGGPGSWDVYQPTRHEPWIIETRVNLVVKDLDDRLDTPYLNSHPEAKRQLRSKLQNMSSSAFSLQQLLYDVSNASLQSVPKFSGVPPKSHEASVLQQAFVDTWSDMAKNQGLPLVAVTAVSQTRDPSQLQLTAFERQVSQVKDAQGIVIRKPSVLQQSCSTLDYLCAANFNALPGTSSFNWNWVLPKEVNDKSGVIAINRQAIGRYLCDQLVPMIMRSCIKPECWARAWAGGSAEYKVTLHSGQTPNKAEVTPEGDKVVHIEYETEDEDSSKHGATYAKVKVRPRYTCDVKFVGETVEIKQQLTVYCVIFWDATWDGFNIFDNIRTDTYHFVVDSYGGLQMTNTSHDLKDQSQSGNLDFLSNAFTNVDSTLNDFKRQIKPIISPRFGEVPINKLQSFVFPGGRVFSFSHARFSKHQDLICDITYVSFNDGWRMVQKAASEAVVTHSLTLKSELMQNYVQGQIATPTSRFQALQTADGHSLLFALDSATVLHVIVEQSSSCKTGWSVTDLTSALIADRFGGDASISLFAVGQSAVDCSIGMIVVVRAGGTDHVFLSLCNSSSSLEWTAKPGWRPVPFDAATERPKTIAVSGVMFAETDEAVQYVIVDIDRLGSQSPAKKITRYYIDPERSTGTLWVKHDVPVDIESGDYQSCVGRLAPGWTDGVFTLGRAGREAQLVYVPVINVFGLGPPQPLRLHLPNDEGGERSHEIPSAMAAARNLDGRSPLTDLYVVGGSTLYRLAAEASPLEFHAVARSDFLSGTDTLLAMAHNGITTIWGKNASNQVYYLSCPHGQLDMPGSWSAPVPILCGIEKISAYINRADGGNTIFASGGGKLQRISQASNTAAKVWRTQEIVLDAPPRQQSLAFKSYTTLVHVTGDNDLPASNVMLDIKTDSCTPVYINGLYYLLGPKPVKVKTDSTGSLSIVEATTNLNSATYTVSVDGAANGAEISPMSKSLDKITALNSHGKLRGASFPAETVAGGIVGKPKQKPLVPSSASDKDVQAVAEHLKKMDHIFQKARAAPKDAPERLDVVPATLFYASPRVYESPGDQVALAPGDLFSWLKSGVEALFKLVYDAASDAWHFVASIAGKVYRAILDTFDAIAGALEWVFNEIKTAIVDLIHYIEFLFEWDDIRRTKNVLYNIVDLYVRHQIDSIPDVKDAFDQHIDDAEALLKNWGGMADTSSLGEVMSKPAHGSAANPTKDHTPASQLLVHHLHSNAQNLTILEDNPIADVAEELIYSLLDALSREGLVVEGVFKDLKDLAMQFASLSVGEVMRKLTVILLGGVLSSTRVVVDALFNVLHHTASSGAAILTTKIHIPIISDILNAIGVPDISILDLFTWIVGVGYTVIYKLAEGKAPFPDDELSRGLVSAKSWRELEGLFHGPVPNGKAPGALHSDPLAAMSKETFQTVSVATHASAAFIIISANFLNIFEAEAQSGDNDFSLLCTGLGIVGAAFQGGANILVPRAGLRNPTVRGLSITTTVLVFAAKVVFSGFAQRSFAKWGGKFSSLTVSDGRSVGAVVNAFLVIPAIIVTGYHFYELDETEVGADRSAGIVGEVTNLTQYISRVAYAAAVNDKEPESRQVFIGIMAASNVAAAGLQIAEAAIH
ncbi:hypothetical protein CDD81_7381 [Ophiocordyceps australis]|uniref:Uncharacterized protein n=1 Tax=Ophiocordyceps australis TaxID=1399860 RepID=A0A2C5Y0H3_9HYPO|nr:hypothetical protein CDD81_7381 [Ophiocordyceps australis]